MNAAVLSIESLAIWHTRQAPEANRYVPAPFARRLAQELEAAAAQPNGKLLVSLPPRHSKTTSLRYLIARFLGRNPTKRVIYVTHSFDLAHEIGGEVRDVLAAAGPQFGITVDPGQAAGEWTTSEGGGALFCGWGKAILGWGADLIVCDDVYQDIDSAENDDYTTKFMRWFQTMLLGRLEPNGSVIVNSARIGVNDVIAQLAARGWPYHCYPALSADGKPLWPSRWSKEQLEAKRDAVGPRAWASQWQGDPKPEGELLFDERWLMTLLEESRAFEKRSMGLSNLYS